MNKDTSQETILMKIFNEEISDKERDEIVSFLMQKQQIFTFISTLKNKIYFIFSRVSCINCLRFMERCELIDEMPTFMVNLLCPHFKHNDNLFNYVSSNIYRIIKEYETRTKTSLTQDFKQINSIMYAYTNKLDTMPI